MAKRRTGIDMGPAPKGVRPPAPPPPPPVPGAKNTIPIWRKPAVTIPVQDLREFIARYGPDVAVLVTWTEETKMCYFNTIGSNQRFADSAVNLRDIIAKVLEMHPLDTKGEDLRGDHPNVALNVEQIDFLLWTLGHIFGEAASKHDGFKAYVQRHHDPILELLGKAKDRVINQPPA